jgi:hypothetical protein
LHITTCSTQQLHASAAYEAVVLLQKLSSRVPGYSSSSGVVHSMSQIACSACVMACTFRCL